MEGIGKGKVGTAQTREQAWPQKQFSLMAASKLPLGASLAFHVWQKPSCYSHDDVVASSVAPKPSLQFPSANTSPAEESDANDKKVLVYPTPDLAQKNSSHASGAISGAVDHGSTAKTDEDQTQAPEPADSECNFASVMNPKKLRRILSNRLSAQRSRLKKIQRLCDLEMQVRIFEAQIGILQPEVAAYENQKQLLNLEQRTLSKKLAAYEEENYLKEAEIEKNKAEVQILRELEKKQDEDLLAQAMMVFNWNTVLPQLADPTNQFGPGQMVYTNSAQGFENKEEKPAMELDTSQQQGQMWILEPDEQKMNFNTGQLSELDAIVNTSSSMLSKKASNTDFPYGFKY